MDATKTAPCNVAIDEECLSASLVFAEEAEANDITREQLVQLLTDAKIKSSPGLEERIDKLASVLAEGNCPTKPVVITKGRPADPGEHGWFELNPEVKPQQEDEDEDPDAPINFYEQNRIITVSDGQAVGTIHPPRPPKAGEDVFGKPIKLPPKQRPVEMGKNVRLDADGATVLATMAGKLDHDRSQVAVVEVLEIPGDVDFESGNVDAPSDVLIRGGVLDLFSVKSGKSVEVGRNIDAAEVHADGDILVRGGICGKEKGKVTCGGQLRAKFCDSVQIEAEGDIHINREAINCSLKTSAGLFIPHGSLIGGTAHARNGGEIRILGSDANVATQIGIGMDPAALVAASEIDEKIRSLKATAGKIRTAVQPLLDSLRRLTAEQREKATELMFQADDLDAQTEELTEQKKTLLERAKPVEGASLLVAGRICEGVTISVDEYSLRFDKELPDSSRIEKRKVENVTEMVAVNQLSGSVTVLPARKIELPDGHPDTPPDA